MDSMADAEKKKIHVKTSKEKENHGYGLKSIGFAVKKYHGQAVSRARDGHFRLTITFPVE